MSCSAGSRRPRLPSELLLLWPCSPVGRLRGARIVHSQGVSVQHKPATASLRKGDLCGGFPAELAVFGNDRGVDAAADIETGGEAHEARCDGAHQVIEYLVGHRLVECAPIAE